ncbi:chorismate-binding protein [Streptomyces verrucosisporus]|uniref:anthranilate synthase family protein n=1 Tax=Streptomyces verrucosisporus TaxID=1695161 RepID=UPI0019D30922|nr:anthranilate synthase family protein [Streptomyces verrucosisporus]MBN3932077.1 chorismate-binding protein [Streptomyces verrucosisporus]
MSGTERPEPAAAELLERILSSQPPAFALLYRPEATGPEELDVLVGDITTPKTLADLPVSGERPRTGGPRHEVLTLVPYRQITERGFACADDDEPLIAMTVTGQGRLPVAEALRRLPDVPIDLADGDFDVDDETYADVVRRVIADEIGTGEGANFVIKRSFVADIADYTPHSALSFFRRLVRKESGAYWTFVIHTGSRTFVGATPERHVSLSGGTAVMNPISGTYRYPSSGPTLPEVLAFLTDRKESDELYMVVDEELKMMARICDSGGRVVGPRLKEMARLAHTEYFIEGRSAQDPREILRESMFAPTVTGSPLESACRVISRYEPRGRGYYSGVAALIGRDEHGEPALDSSILIRTADIGDGGRMTIGVGATLVRHSDPVSEVAETRAKAAGLLAALQAAAPAPGSRSLAHDTTPPARFEDHPDVRASLERRNATLAGFWLAESTVRNRPDPELAGRRVLVVDAEDTFTAMIGHQLRSMGLSVTIRRFDEPYTLDGQDLVVMGPGPGDPRETSHPKIAHLRSAIDTLLEERRPFLAVCLSHQVLSMRLGFDLVRREVPNQGAQREIDLFGARERVGFYNTFAARSAGDEVECGGVGTVEVSRDAETGEVHALRGPHFASMQFHAESVLTEDGVRIVGSLMAEVLGGNGRGRTQRASHGPRTGRSPLTGPHSAESGGRPVRVDGREVARHV